MRLIKKQTVKNVLVGGIFLGIIFSAVSYIHGNIIEVDLFLIFCVVTFLCIGYLFLHKLIYQHIIMGAPNVTSSKENIENIIYLLKTYNCNNIVDLGSGNGKLMIEIAKRGFKIHGIEINQLMVLVTKLKLILLKLFKHKLDASVTGANFWNHDLSQYNTVIIYGISYISNRLQQKLITELDANSYIISVYFKLNKLQKITQKGEIYMYKIEDFSNRLLVSNDMKL